MKLIYAAAALLVAVCALALFNIHFMDGLIGGLLDELNQAETAAQQGDFETAAELVQGAADTWRAKESYTHIAIRHGDVDHVTVLFYDLLGHLYAEESGVSRADFEKLRSGLTELWGIERITFGSVF